MANLVISTLPYTGENKKFGIGMHGNPIDITSSDFEINDGQIGFYVQCTGDLGVVKTISVLGLESEICFTQKGWHPQQVRKVIKEGTVATGLYFIM